MNPSEKKFQISDYEGALPSTLCLGCGHDLISRHLIKACYEAQLDPFKIAKVSGIGCSSKTPSYFLKLSQGFNTLHGRMASVATGIKLSNKELTVIGVSGDGDTGNIGLGGFLHAVRKNVPMVYIVENNGVYGLTKGQTSTTAKAQNKKHNTLFPSLDLCQLALDAGCGFVARSFSGDGKQMVSLLKLALKYKGFSFIDVISPCVAYGGNEKTFPHSYPYIKEHNQVLNEWDLIEEKENLSIDIEEGERRVLPFSNQSSLVLKKIHQKEHNPTNKQEASELLRDSALKTEIATGLIYCKPSSTFLEHLELSEKTLVSMKDEETRPSSATLRKIMKLFT